MYLILLNLLIKYLDFLIFINQTEINLKLLPYTLIIYLTTGTSEQTKQNKIDQLFLLTDTHISAWTVLNK